MRAGYVLCRVAYAATDHDPTTRDRRLRDFPAATRLAAEGNARRWAAEHDRERTAADRSRWPWVLERWDPAGRCWEFVSNLT